MKAETLIHLVDTLADAKRRMQAGDLTAAACGIDLVRTALADLEADPEDWRETVACAAKLGHRDTCGAVALSVVTGTPYRYMAAACARFGGFSPKGGGTDLPRMVSALGLKVREVPYGDWMPPSGEMALYRIGNKLRRIGHGKGRYLVYTFRHVSAVVDGEVCDMRACRRSSKNVRRVEHVAGGITQARLARLLAGAPAQEAAGVLGARAGG